MGIIENKVRKAFEEFSEDNDIYKFAEEMAHIGDYSVKSAHNWWILTNSINKIKNERTKPNEVCKKRR